MGVASKQFRPEIHGLRAIAALLVAVYHLWFDRISGGVDVFFVVSGFLITESLVRQAESRGRIDALAYLTRLFKRLFPAAMLVLLFVVGGSLLWLPQVRWAETVPEILASALYYQNWQLAITSTDYLAQDAAASPVQHYWALSIQGQFYILWPALVLLVASLAHRFGAGVRQGMPVALAALFSASLVFSIFATRDDQAFAYFHTFARIWEFALGGLLALALPWLNPGWWVRLIAGWLGLLAILICGMVIPADQFPGYAALWPTLGAALVIIAGTGHVRFGAERLLSSRPMQWFGDIAYSLYLWHWPLMILFMAAGDRDGVRGEQAIFILLASILLAWLTTRLVENPVRHSRIGQQRRWHGPALAAICLTPVLLSALIWSAHISHQQRLLDHYLVGGAEHPGAAAMVPALSLPPVETEAFIPPVVRARADLPRVYRDGCHQERVLPAVVTCEYADTDSDFVVAVVGGSHSAHWLPAMIRAGKTHGWKIVAMTKSGCRFDGELNSAHESCRDWNRLAVDELAQLRPNLAFMPATLGRGEDEHVPEGYIRQWRRLEEAGIPVLAVRDTPRMDFNVPECVERYGPDAEQCQRKRAKLFASTDMPRPEELPGNVRLVDLTDFFCDEVCTPVVGNVLVYRDTNHITATYATTLAPMVSDLVIEHFSAPRRRLNEVERANEPSTENKDKQ